MDERAGLAYGGVYRLRRCREADLGRRQVARLLEEHAVALEPAVSEEMCPRPQIDLEETVDALPEARGQLRVGRLEIARPRLEGQEVAVAVVVQRDWLEGRAVDGSQELGQDHGGVITRKDVPVVNALTSNFRRPAAKSM